VQRLYHELPTWDHVGRLIAERVYQQLNERGELLQFYTPTQRYEYLQQHQPELLAHVSHAQLASYLGVQPESLSRIRHRLSQRQQKGGAAVLNQRQRGAQGRGGIFVSVHLAPPP
jgi:CRP-like cAMP-binding protein